MNDRKESDPNPEEKIDLNDEEVIDLTNIVDAEADETIIELDDVIEPAAPVADESEDDVIPLLDVVPDEKAEEPEQDPGETIVDLMDVTDDDQSQPEPSMEEEAYTAPETSAPPIVETEAAVDATEKDDAPSAVSIEAIPLTQQQLEDALTRVIEKTYKEKIEQLLIQTIEKTVSQEIERIKNALLSDDEP